MTTDYKVVTTSSRLLDSGVSASEITVNKRGELVRGWPWHLQLVQEGKVYTCGAGTVSTEITFTSTTVVDITLPDFLIRVPSGTTIIPLYMHVYYQATGGTVTEGVALYSTTDPGNGTSSAADRTPVNMKSRGGSSACTTRQLVTVTPTFVNATEFWRWGEPADLDGTVTGESGFTWDYQRNGNVPVIIGPATLHLASGTATSSTGFITVVYAEFTTSSLGLS